MSRPHPCGTVPNDDSAGTNGDGLARAHPGPADRCPQARTRTCRWSRPPVRDRADPHACHERSPPPRRVRAWQATPRLPPVRPGPATSEDRNGVGSAPAEGRSRPVTPGTAVVPKWRAVGPDAASATRDDAVTAPILLLAGEVMVGGVRRRAIDRRRRWIRDAGSYAGQGAVARTGRGGGLQAVVSGAWRLHPNSLSAERVCGRGRGARRAP